MQDNISDVINNLFSEETVTAKGGDMWASEYCEVQEVRNLKLEDVVKRGTEVARTIYISERCVSFFLSGWMDTYFEAWYAK